MKLKKILLFFAFATAINSLAQIIPTFQNVDYTGNNNIFQKLDIYIPPGLTAPAPVIVFIHGGGWYTGSKGANNVAYFEPCYNAGFICVDINYRLTANNDRWPKQIEDCKAAIRFLKANASIYGIDKCRFGVMGSSAGGHLSAMMGTTGDVVALEGAYLGNTTENSRIQAVVDLFGPTDFSLMDGNYSSSCGTGVLVHEQNSPECALLNIPTLSSNPTLVQSANPIAYITPDDAKFFIMHGSNDCTVPTNQSVILRNALTSGAVTNTYVIATNQGHGGTWYQDPLRTFQFRDFFLTHLSNPCSTLALNTNEIKKIKIYPNPATSEISILISNNEKFSLEIFNVIGELVLKCENQKNISISNFQNGIYIVKVKFENTTITEKIIKY